MMGNEGDILKLLASQLSDGVVTVNEAGNVIYANDALTAGTGYTSAEVIGRSFASLFPPSDDAAGVRHPVEQTLSGGQVASYTLRFRGRDFDVTLLPCRAEGALRAAAARAVAVFKSSGHVADPRAARLQMVGLFATGVVHDVNNDLTALIGNIQMAETHLADIESAGGDAAALAGQARRHLGDADKVTKHTSALVRHLLAYARQREPEREAINANDTILETVELTRKLMSPDIAIELGLEDGLRPVLCERTQFDRILTNLLLNARDAMPDGGRIRIETASVLLGDSFRASRPSWAKTGAFVRLSVVDTGKGMDEATLRRIYDDFFTTKSEGVGIGLRNVYHIVKDHGGMIEASSLQGSGSRFDVYLPPAEQGRACRPKEQAGQQTPQRLLEERAARRVLIVEQHEPLRKIMEVMVRQAGYKVVQFEGAARAEELLERMTRRAAAVDVAAIDLSLPTELVRALIHTVKESNPAASVLLTSATESEVPRHLHGPGLRLLRKPFNGYQLVGAIDASLEVPGGSGARGVCAPLGAGREEALIHN